jgi:hypothetical protein
LIEVVEPVREPQRQVFELPDLGPGELGQVRGPVVCPLPADPAGERTHQAQPAALVGRHQPGADLAPLVDDRVPPADADQGVPPGPDDVYEFPGWSVGVE